MDDKCCKSSSDHRQIVILKTMKGSKKRKINLRSISNSDSNSIEVRSVIKMVLTSLSCSFFSNSMCDTEFIIFQGEIDRDE